MDKNLFEKLTKSIEQGLAIHKGEMKPSRIFNSEDVNVKKIRTKMKLSQDKFAEAIGVSVGTLRGWEQHRRKPAGPAKALLRVFEQKPLAVIEALHINTK